MTPDIGAQVIADYGLLGLTILAIGYMVRELLMERKRNEIRTDENHAKHLSDVETLHESYLNRLETAQTAYQLEMRTISSEFAMSVDRLSGSVSSLTVKVDVMLGEIEDLKVRQEAHDHRENHQHHD